jgi:hypothetical protein
MKAAFTILVTSLALFAEAQPCSQEELATQAGSFKAGMPGSIRNVTPADLTRERATLSKLHRSISSSYQPTGAQVSYAYVFGKHLPAARNWVADPYHLSYYILRYRCEPVPKAGKTFYVDVSTPTTVTICANTIYALNNLYAAELDAEDSRGYLLLDRKPERKNGAWFLGDVVVGDRWTDHEIHEYRWLITYSDTLPFTILTRREYLHAVKKRIDREVQRAPDRSDEYRVYLQRVNEYLGHDAGDLAQPAYVRINDEERFNGFLDEAEGRGYYPVVPNMAYYRKKLPASTPQFFSVVYKISKGDPVFESNIANLQKAIDFENLRRLLGK